jgi:ACS family hexuronate transporter-like MFS transporter
MPERNPVSAAAIALMPRFYLTRLAAPATFPTVAPDDAPHREARRAWRIVALLFAATFLNYLDRQVLSLTAEHIIEEFRLTKEDFGRILAAFRYAYALLQIAGGWIVDLRGPVVIFPIAVGLWSAAGVLTGFTRSAGMLAFLRFLLGVGEAFNWPCALNVTRRLVEERDRPLANGIFNSGAAAGALLAPVIVTVLAANWGWRAAFVVTGALGSLWIAAWLRSTRGVRGDLGATGGRGTVPAVVVSVLRDGWFWRLSVSAVIANSVNYFLGDWIPLYLKTERGFGFAAGNALSMAVYGSLEAGNILIGLFVRRAASAGHTVAQARRVGLIGACMLMSSAAFAGLAPRGVAVACLMLTALGVGAFLVIYLTMVQELEPRHVGTVAGLLGGFGNLAYGAVSPLIGRLADSRRTTLTFLLVGSLPWVALASMLGGSIRRRRR